MRKVRFDQNTDEWLLWRTKGIGASDAPIIAGVSPYKTLEELKVDKLAHWGCHTRDTNSHKNQAQIRGSALEPVARDAYIAFTGREMTTACVIHDTHDWMRASLDGLAQDESMAVEIKCIRWDYHQEALGGWVPTIYYPQVQHQLAITGHRIMHYWSYSRHGSFKDSERQALVVVKRNDAYIEHLIGKEQALWDELTEEVEKRKKERKEALTNQTNLA